MELCLLLLFLQMILLYALKYYPSSDLEWNLKIYIVVNSLATFIMITSVEITKKLYPFYKQLSTNMYLLYLFVGISGLLICVIYCIFIGYSYPILHFKLSELKKFRKILKKLDIIFGVINISFTIIVLLITIIMFLIDYGATSNEVNEYSIHLILQLSLTNISWLMFFGFFYLAVMFLNIIRTIIIIRMKSYETKIKKLHSINEKHDLK